MATSKPDMSVPIWASGSSLITEPSDAKKTLGWEVEKPPVEWMNWLQNRFDEFQRHINENGE